MVESERERLKASMPTRLANAIWLAAKAPNSESPRQADAVLAAAIQVWPEVVDEIAGPALERAERLYQTLCEVEKHCPCGARPESPNTHPHVSGCPVGQALWDDAPKPGAGAPKPDCGGDHPIDECPLWHRP